jgi:beta-glucosidase/6-phospho-beta-glucosidase/beta-galactosidase
MSESPFKSFFMGGFECSTHRDARGRRLDLIASTCHDTFAENDYGRLVEIGIGTARDGLRWHLIEPEPFRYDFSSAKRQIAAAKATGIQVVWDYFHYGYPDDLDIFSDAFIERFAAFAAEATRLLSEELGYDLIVCPVNEISFFSWIAGSVGQFYPCVRRRGLTLKRQLVRSAAAATKAIKAVNPGTRIVTTDPAINVIAEKNSPNAKKAAENYRRSQFQAFDMLAGIAEPELGGRPEYLDILGLNYYFHNQWTHPSRKKIPLGHENYRPLEEILEEFSARYKRPVIIAETGIEDDERRDWFRYVCERTRVAKRKGVDVQGVCLYPIVNHPGWADNRHCHNGLWDYPDETGHREIYQPLADEIYWQQGRNER